MDDLTLEAARQLADVAKKIRLGGRIEGFVLGFVLGAAFVFIVGRLF